MDIMDYIMGMDKLSVKTIFTCSLFSNEMQWSLKMRQH